MQCGHSLRRRVNDFQAALVDESAVGEAVIVAVFADNAAERALGEGVQQFLRAVGERPVGDVVAADDAPAGRVEVFELIPAKRGAGAGGLRLPAGDMQGFGLAALR